MVLARGSHADWEELRDNALMFDIRPVLHQVHPVYGLMKKSAGNLRLRSTGNHLWQQHKRTRRPACVSDTS